MTAEPLVCPSCASTHSLDERFCPKCGMPLVYAGATGVDTPVTARHERARKIKKQYTDGRLVTVASARHQAEAELIQGLLLEEGVPSMVRRSGGFDVPDMLFAGPRDILVPESGAQTAREVLGTVEHYVPPPAGVTVHTTTRSTRTLALALAGVLAVAGLSPIVVWVWGQLHG
jgi:hypothetical protein